MKDKKKTAGQNPAQDSAQEPNQNDPASTHPDNPATPETPFETSTNPSGENPPTTAPKNDNNELEETREQLRIMTETAKRALSDLQNFKRRTEEEKSAFIQYANASLFTEMLPAIQNMQRSLQHEPKDEEWTKGAIQTMKQLLSTCEKAGLSPIHASSGTPFDHNFHEALLTAPGEKDIILEELEPGFMLGEKVLKPARVKVGNGEKA